MSNMKKPAGRFAGKGYYIALILCATAIGISGYLYYRSATTDSPDVDPTGGVVDVLNTNGSGSSLPVPTKPTVNTNPSPVPRPMQTGMPIEGQVVTEYAMDCLCYNPTTRDWRVHDGIDYAAPAGTPVKAAAEGTVYTVYKDDALGYTVVLCHADGYVTTYSSLSAEVTVSVGDTVQLGDVIGYVGCSAMLETAIGDHLHFCVTMDGESVDPEDFYLLS